MSTLSHENSYHQERAYWSGVLAMTLCVFVLIASEFMRSSMRAPGDMNFHD